MAAKHFVWQLYLALANEGGSEPEGRAAIKALLPKLAGDVDKIISVAGDVSKLDTELTDKHDGILQAEETALATAPVNDGIRDRAGRRGDFTAPAADINAAIRDRAGRRALTGARGA